MRAIAVSVVAAFFACGVLKEETPLEIASTPVSAVHPAENARSTRNQTNGLVSLTGSAGVPTAKMLGSSPVNTFTMPKMIVKLRMKTKPYVGIEKSVPDSRTPRRFPIAMRKTSPTASGMAKSTTAPWAETIASTQAAMLTATVRM